jgi:hypothetical protein
MSENQTLVVLVLLGLSAVLAVVCWLRVRPETAPGTATYRWALRIAIALVVVALFTPLLMLAFKVISRN